MGSDELTRKRLNEQVSEVASERWGSVKDPGATPSGRYSPTLWGRDGMAVQKRHQGTTLRQLEESGEFMLINDPDLQGLAKDGEDKAPADPNTESSSRTKKR